MDRKSTILRQKFLVSFPGEIIPDICLRDDVPLIGYKRNKPKRKPDMTKENRNKARVDEAKAKAGIGAFKDLLSNEPVDFMPVVLDKSTWEVLTGGKADRSVRVYFGLRPGEHGRSIVEMIGVGTSPDETGNHRDSLGTVMALGDSVREISQSQEVWKASRTSWNEWQKRFKKPIKAEDREEFILPNAVLLHPGVLSELFEDINLESVTLQPIMDTEVNLLMVSDDPEGSQEYYNFSMPCPPYCDSSTGLF